MDHTKVLKRAWEILWQYRVLWVFGVIVVLCAAGANPNFFSGGGDGGGHRGVNVSPWTGGWRWGGEPFAQVVPEILGAWVAVAGVILAIIAALCCLGIIVTIARVVFLYIGETALIRMVDDYEETGEKRGVRQGFRLGWSRTALRLFVIDLVTKIPGFMALVVAGALVLGAVGLTVWLPGAVVLKVIVWIATVGMVFLLVLAAVAIALGMSLVRPLIFRVCALAQLGVIGSLRTGFAFIKAHLGDTAIMWLIMVGLQIGWIIIMIPVVLFLVLVGAVVGGLAGLSVGGLSSLVFEGAVPWILGFGVGIPIFILIMAAPLVFLGGLAEVFKSSVWTLTYRELRALGGPAESGGQLPDASAAGS